MDSFLYPSLLEKDDISGPGKGDFPRSSKGYSVDYALYKISLYSNIDSTGDKIKFIKDLDSLILQLGQKDSNVLFRLFTRIVLSI